MTAEHCVKAAIYARKSTDQSGVSDDQRSVARQMEHARTYIVSQLLVGRVRFRWTVCRTTCEPPDQGKRPIQSRHRAVRARYRCLCDDGGCAVGVEQVDYDVAEVRQMTSTLLELPGSGMEVGRFPNYFSSATVSTFLPVRAASAGRMRL